MIDFFNPSNNRTAFYVVLFAGAPQPSQIVGWQTLIYGKDDPVPAFTPGGDYVAFYLPEMTQAEWDDLRFNQNGCGGGLAYDNGKIVPYTPPPPPLKDQAAAAMQNVRQQAAMTSAMGETFGTEMQAYVRALRAILDGTDTTSTTLPTAPADPAT